METIVENRIFDKKKNLETVKDIKNKFENLKKENFLLTEGQSRLFKPIVEPLKSIDETLQKKQSSTTISTKMEKDNIKKENEKTSNDSMSEYTGKNMHPITQNLSYTYPITKNPNINWGISVMGKTETGNPNYMMTLSKCPLKFTKDLIVAKGRSFPKTRSLYSLLTAKKNYNHTPQEEEDYINFLKYTGDFYLNPKTPSDTARFKYIIKKYREREPSDTLYETVSSDKSQSVEENITTIAPDTFSTFEDSFKKEKDPLTSTSTPKKRKGTGIAPLENFAKVNKLNPKLEFVWYDNLNEIVERYKLLIAAQEAGHTNVTNELLAIEEELNELGIRKKK